MNAPQRAKQAGKPCEGSLLGLLHQQLAIGLATGQDALTLALLSVSQLRYLSDHRVPINLLILISMLVSALAVLALWDSAKSLAAMVVFAIVYGLFGAGYVAMWARMGSAVTKEPTAALAMFSLFCFRKGVGNVVARPSSAALIEKGVAIESYSALV
ncbi:hypothetical protein LSUE1_G002031 [Lachnellula suecica]|uniref:Uncharacterized protein n=1 Tax=Lachnellula suecica TaxID=602035 RepID=A0A8T9C6P5_9HELO|nr:hypothetical protein LSUE1_G002031 [Lachnellula suecica]